MSPHVETIVKEAGELSPIEQIELLSAISQLLQSSYKKLPIFHDFWIPKTLDQLFNDQYHQPVKNVFDFAGNFWPLEESADDFNQFIYNQRHNDRLSDK